MEKPNLRLFSRSVKLAIGSTYLRDNSTRSWISHDTVKASLRPQDLVCAEACQPPTNAMQVRKTTLTRIAKVLYEALVHAQV
jgi:hypothetical protein